MNLKKAAGFAMQAAAADANLASEKQNKVEKNLPQNVANSEIKVAKQAPAPDAPAKASKIAPARDAVDDKVKAAAATFISPYTAMTEAIKSATIPSAASRRRAVKKSAATPVTIQQEAAEASEPVVSEKKGAATAGFTAHYWNKVKDVKNMADAIKKISKRKPSKSETVSEINFKPTEDFWAGLDNSYSQNFVARFRGHLTVPAGGIYQFFSESDDGSVVYVNGKQVVTNDGVKDEMVSKSGKVSLQAGKADIVVDYFASGEGMPGLVVEWEGGGMAKQPINAQHVVQMNTGGAEELVQLGENEVVSLDY